MKFKFLYHDIPANKQTIESYKSGTYIHENNRVVASTLRGGFLTGCNLRYLFFTAFSGEDLLVNDDYKKQGLYIFEPMLYYNIHHKYKAGHFAQILLSPDNELPDDFVIQMIEAAVVDFNQLLNTKPVPVLDTPDWHRRIGTDPLGKYGKQPDHINIKTDK